MSTALFLDDVTFLMGTTASKREGGAAERRRLANQEARVRRALEKVSSYGAELSAEDVDKLVRELAVVLDVRVRTAEVHQELRRRLPWWRRWSSDSTWATMTVARVVVELGVG